MKKKNKNLKQYLNPTKNQRFFSWASKGISTPVGILIVLLVAVVAGLLIWQMWPEEELIVSPSPTPTPSTDETAGWKVYRNEEYGFEIKYPKDYLIKEEKISHGLEEEQPPEFILDYRYDKPVWLLNEVEIYSPSFPSEGEKIEINIWNNANNLTVSQWLNYINEGVNQGFLYEGRLIGNREPFSIMGIEAIKGTYGCCGRCIKGVFMAKGDKIYNLGLDGKDGCNFGDESIFNQILSTFKFID